MRKLSEIDSNIFTTQIVDIILPGCSFAQSKKAKAKDRKDKNPVDESIETTLSK